MAVTTLPAPPASFHASNVNPPKACSLNPLHPALSLSHSSTQFRQLPDSFSVATTYASALESCHCPKLCTQIHAHALKSGFGSDRFVATKLLQLYGTLGYLEDAVLLFDKMSHRNLHSWKAILDAHVDSGLYEEACSYFFRMLNEEESALEFFVFPVVSKICGALGALELGKQVHGMVMKHGFFGNLYVGNALVDMYGKCGCIGGTKEVFAVMGKKDCVTWNSLVSACATNGMVHDALGFLEMILECEDLTPTVVSWSAVIGGFWQSGYDGEAIELMYRMIEAGVEPNARTLASVLPACARLRSLTLGKELHGYIIRHGIMTNSFVVNGLVDVYRKCSEMEAAFRIFSNHSRKNEVSFNTMIVGYCENGDTCKARQLFDEMEAFGFCKGIISWNSMLSGYVDNYCFHEAWRLFVYVLVDETVEPDSSTIGSVLSACADMGSLKRGKEIQAQAIIRGLDSDPHVGGALVELYSKWKDITAARIAFDCVGEKNASTWNALIAGYARCDHITEACLLVHDMELYGFQPSAYTWNGIIAGSVGNGHNESALRLFLDMQTLFLKPDKYTVGIVISACSKLSTIHRGKQLHAYAIRCGCDSDAHIGVALLDMYAKCGSIKGAKAVYDRMQNPDLVSQNAMLNAYAMHGYGDDGIDLFRRMIARGYVPDHVTFLSVLTSCVHAGSVDSGYQFFDMMGLYKVTPSLKHYTCMVDLLSRAGRLDCAYELMRSMPVEPDAVAWNAFLGGCVIHRNVELGELAAERLVELEPHNTGNLVLLANLYASGNRWIQLNRTRQRIRDLGMQKTAAGCSWIESRDETQVFVASDASHGRSEEIYGVIDLLRLQMRKLEFVDAL
uniref:Chlororespiratory reduction 21 n=1 Tax=Kalanchoe fedtschenkoi TaxID=63787 RepID=A0A7N0T9Q9_KALFE